MSLRLSKDYIDIIDTDTVGVLPTMKKGDYTLFLNTPILKDLNSRNELLSTKHISDITFTNRHSSDNKTKYHRLSSLFSFEGRILDLTGSYVITRFDFYPNNLKINEESFFSFVKSFRDNVITSPYRDLLLGYIVNIEKSTSGKWHLHLSLFLDGERYCNLNKTNANSLYTNDLKKLKQYLSIMLSLSSIKNTNISVFDMSIAGSRYPLVLITKNDIPTRNCSRYWISYNCKDNNDQKRLLSKKMFSYKSTKKVDILYPSDRLLDISDRKYLMSIHPSFVMMTRRLEAIFSFENDISIRYGDYVILPMVLSSTDYIDIGDYMDMMGSFTRARSNTKYLGDNLLGYNYTYRLENGRWVMYWYMCIRPVANDIIRHMDDIITSFKSWIRRRKNSVKSCTISILEDYNKDTVIVTPTDYNARNRIRIMISGLAYTTRETIDYTSNYSHIRLYGSYIA